MLQAAAIEVLYQYFWQCSLRVTVSMSDSSKHHVGRLQVAETLAVAPKVKCVVKYLLLYRYQTRAKGFKNGTVLSLLNVRRRLRIQDKSSSTVEKICEEAEIFSNRFMSGIVILSCCQRDFYFSLLLNCEL